VTKLPSGPGTPNALGGSDSVFSFDKLKQFVNDKSNEKLFKAIGAVGQAINQYTTTESQANLRSAEQRYYDTRSQLINTQLRNASAAGRLYGG